MSVLQLVQSLQVLSHHVIFYNLSTPEQILNLFPESFHSSLKNLITKILLENWCVCTLIKLHQSGGLTGPLCLMHKSEF